MLPDSPYQLYRNRTTSQGTLKFTGTRTDAPLSSRGHAAKSSAMDQTPGNARGAAMNAPDGQGKKVLSPNGHGAVGFQDSRFESTDCRESHSCTSSVPQAASRESTTKMCTPPSDTTTATTAREQPESGGSNKGPAKAGDANFVSEFYSNSRLHHISTWGAEFKAFVNELQNCGDTSTILFF